MKGTRGLSELEIGMASNLRAYSPDRILPSTPRIQNGLTLRRWVTVVGRGHAVAPVIRSIPGSVLAGFEKVALLGGQYVPLESRRPGDSERVRGVSVD